MSAHHELLLERCDFLVESQLWPLQRNLNYSGWLSNFTEEERNFAERLLMNFMYYSNDLTKHLFRFAFNKLASANCDFREADEVLHEQWLEFLHNVAITHVTGEDPSPTDKGGRWNAVNSFEGPRELERIRVVKSFCHGTYFQTLFQ